MWGTPSRYAQVTPSTDTTIWGWVPSSPLYYVEPHMVVSGMVLGVYRYGLSLVYGLRHLLPVLVQLQLPYRVGHPLEGCLELGDAFFHMV